MAKKKAKTKAKASRKPAKKFSIKKESRGTSNKSKESKIRKIKAALKRKPKGKGSWKFWKK